MVKEIRAVVLLRFIQNSCYLCKFEVKNKLRKFDAIKSPD